MLHVPTNSGEGLLTFCLASFFTRFCCISVHSQWAMSGPQSRARVLASSPVLPFLS